jgi:hypothetical protein
MITHTFKPGALISPATTQQDESSSTTNPSQSSHSQGFFTVQIPLAHNPSVQAPEAPMPDALRDHIHSTVPKDTIFASYASVERVLSLPAEDVSGKAASAAEGNLDENKKRIEWTMATTSDAGGLIPQWVQRSWTMGGVPKAVAADVGLFLGWTAKQRTT